VFPVEPKAQGDEFESVLRGLDNVILTPHVGGSTQEAQEEIGWFVAGKFVGFVEEGNTSLAVNLPDVAVPPREPGHSRLGLLHHNVPGVLAQVTALFAEEECNVVGQHLATRGDLGYVVTDSTGPLWDEAVARLRDNDHCLWVRTW
jgi:D-3-phosphoglycerate dehydrogenase